MIVEFKRLLRSPMLYLVLLIGSAILLRPLLLMCISGEIGMNMGFYTLFSYSWAASDFTPFAALFAVLPYADSFCDDYNSGYSTAITILLGVDKYSFRRAISVAISGGIVMAILVMITIVVCDLFSNSPDVPDNTDFMFNTIWAKMGILFLYNGLVFKTLKVLVAFLFGSLWALVGLAISTVVINKYVTNIAPFVLYQIIWFLLPEQRWNPVYLLRADSNFIPSLWFVLLYQGSLIIVFFTLSVLGIRRRIKI